MAFAVFSSALKRFCKEPCDVDMGVRRYGRGCCSISLQCFPAPKVRGLLFANQPAHRAGQHRDVEVVAKHIPWDQLSICFHSHAGFGSASWALPRTVRDKKAI